MTAALAHMPTTLDELLRLLGDTCAVCGEETAPAHEDGVDVAACASCGTVLEAPEVAQRPRLRLVP